MFPWVLGALPTPRACRGVNVQFAGLLDSRQPSSTEVPMHWIWLGVFLTVRLRLLSLAAEPHATSGQ